jgi:abortive infection bacteriophage resistance protein
MIQSNSEHDFVEHTSFEQVMRLYTFDHKIRILLFDAIETIEVALRAKVINLMSQTTRDGLWYLNSNLFENVKFHEDFVHAIKLEFERSTEPFAKEYIRTHVHWNSVLLSGDNPDAWMILEVATFGTLSKMYKNLKSQSPARAAIAKEFGMHSAKEFANWLEGITVIRNIVAHHARLWNRTFSKKMMNIKSPRGVWLQHGFDEKQTNRLYAAMAAMVYLCNAVDVGNSLAQRVCALIQQYPDVPIRKLGFGEDWMSEPLWR